MTHASIALTRSATASTRALVAGGSVILLAARVQPHVAPGQISATEEFRGVFGLRP